MYYVPYGGKELSKEQYEVLIAPPAALSWVECSGSNIPANETYYIGRAIHEGTVTVGTVQRSHGTCYISYGGEEHGYENYEILVRNAFGRYLGV